MANSRSPSSGERRAITGHENVDFIEDAVQAVSRSPNPPSFEPVIDPTSAASPGGKQPLDASASTRTPAEGDANAVSVRYLTHAQSAHDVQPESFPMINDLHNDDQEYTFPGGAMVNGAKQGHEAQPSQSNRSSRRNSFTSNLYNVNLSNESSTKESEDPVTEERSPSPTKESGRIISLGSITSALPTLPWGPVATQDSSAQLLPTSRSQTQLAPTPSAPDPPATSSRKISSAFSWLSRGSTTQPRDSSAPLSPPISQLTPLPTPRRGTTSSMATLTSNPELNLGRLDEEREDSGVNGNNGTKRDTFRDRFHVARMRGESISAETREDGKSSSVIGSIHGQDSNLGSGLISIAADGKANGLKLNPSATKSSASSIPPSPNPALGPGTASGVSAGPPLIPDARVDWDLWQSVVYEGPIVVARTSADELKKAIANGIPSAIRGVIWQVLAQSKNDELGIMYQQLCVRGTDKEKERHSSLSTTASHLSIQSEHIVASSASSVHSDISGVAVPIFTGDKQTEVGLKAQATAATERRRRDQEDLVMLRKLEKTIRRDLGARTSYSKYAAAEGLQEGLFGVCKAYALFDEEVGYTQGMNFVVMPLLFNMTEEEAFCLFVRLMNQYNLRDLFLPDMSGLHRNLYLFERLLEDFEPALYCHLHRKGISPHLYATQWFLTLFAYRFPLQLVLRIYDLVLSEGLSAILRFGLVLMQKNAMTLINIADMQQLTIYLKDKLFDVYIDKSPSAGSILDSGFFGSSASGLDKEVYRADQLVLDACAITLSPGALSSYTTEWQETTKLEKERETELENLRRSNVKHIFTIRKLEERTEMVDREQADLATELVRTKVANQELFDENESLKVEVRELKLVIQQQPEEIERAWALERDNIIQRNATVHEENLRLIGEMQVLEEDLVTTKLRWAELNAQHEALSGKWAELRRQFI